MSCYQRHPARLLFVSECVAFSSITQLSSRMWKHATLSLRDLRRHMDFFLVRRELLYFGTIRPGLRHPINATKGRL